CYRDWSSDVCSSDLDEARADFAAIVKDHADHAEAHVGLAYVAACQNKQADAFREANLALLHGAGDFLILHNVACVYAELSEVDRSEERRVGNGRRDG